MKALVMKMIYYPVLFLIISILALQTAHSQTDVLRAYGWRNSKSAKDCQNWMDYAPCDTALWPVKYLRTAIHIMQDEKGEQNFQNTDAHLLFLEQIIDTMNWRLANLDRPQPCNGSAVIKDSRFRLVLDTIYFHQDSIRWDGSNRAFLWFGNKLHKDWVINDSTISKKQQDSTLHIFLLGNRKHQGGYAPLGKNKYMVVRGIYTRYQQDYPYNDCWVGGASELLHELGHNCGLYHNFQGGQYGEQCDRCDDNDDPLHGTCPKQGTSNNFMDYWPAAPCSLSECQLGRVHFYLSGEQRSIHRCVIRDSLYFRPQDSICLEERQEAHWLSDRYLLKHLLIRPDASLRLSGGLLAAPGVSILVDSAACLELNGFLHLPKQATLVLKPGGRLIVKTNSHINLTNTAQLHCWAGSYLCIEANANVKLHGTDSQLIISKRVFPVDGINSQNLDSLEYSGSGKIIRPD